MQENDFEKQAKKLMDDLRIDPSEPVWNYVEKRIPKSNRRRRFIAFFFLFAGLAVCGYFAYNRFYIGNYKDTVLVFEDSNRAVKKQSDKTVENKNDEVVVTEESKKVATDKTEQKIHRDYISKSENGLRNSESSIGNITINGAKQNDNEENEILNSSTIQGKEKRIANDNTTTNSQLTKEEAKNKQENFITKDNTTVTTNEISTTAEPVDSTKAESIKIDSLQKEDDKGESRKSKPKIQTNTDKNIRFGITAFYGKSDIIEKLSIGSLSAGNPLYDGAYSTPGNGNGNVQRDSIFYEKSAKNVKAKQSFSIGVSAKKTISKRSAITTGIEFTQMKTLIQTGIIKDSSAYFYYNNSSIQTSLANYYTAGGNINRINTYNFIRLPLFYSYQLNKGKNVLLNVDGGFSYARLISANALVYDSYNQAYYKNNDVFNKNQWQFLLGLNTTFLFKNKSTVVLGPQVQYAVSNVSKNYTTQQHLFTWGLQAHYYLKK